MPGSDAHFIRIPLTDQASSGHCSSNPSKLASLERQVCSMCCKGLPGYQCMLLQQLASCLPAAGGCRRLWSCTAEASGRLLSVLRT